MLLDRYATVLLYTDGLVERRTQNLDDGLARLQKTLTGLAGAELDVLCDQLLQGMAPTDPDDDVAIVVVRLHPQNKPSRGRGIASSHARCARLRAPPGALRPAV